MLDLQILEIARETKCFPLTELRWLLFASQESLPIPRVCHQEEARRKLKWIHPCKRCEFLSTRVFDERVQGGWAADLLSSSPRLQTTASASSPSVSGTPNTHQTSLKCQLPPMTMCQQIKGTKCTINPNLITPQTPWWLTPHIKQCSADSRMQFEVITRHFRHRVKGFPSTKTNPGGMKMLHCRIIFLPCPEGWWGAPLSKTPTQSMYKQPPPPMWAFVPKCTPLQSSLA